MNQFTKLSVGKHVPLMFGTLCAILVAIGALFFFSRQTVERGNRESLSYVVAETELAQAAAQNIPG